MDVTFPHCAGLDVHKKTVVACALTTPPVGPVERTLQTFGTMPADLLALSTWLSDHHVTQVVMESTGEFWKPVYNILEASFTVWVVNAQHVKTVPGRKTDVKDAEWLADLLRHGLVRPSFIPPLPQRDLRDLTRQRTCLVQERATVVNRLHKVLEWANLKLTSVVTDVTGVSARAILTALLAGETDPVQLAALAQGRLRSKRAALEAALAGYVRDHHRFLLTQHLLHLEFLEEQLATDDQQILAALPAVGSPATPALVPPAPEAAARPLSGPAARPLLDGVPGIGPTVAEVLIAEIGTDMSRFPSAAHLASWAKVAPGNHESAGKSTSGKTGRGSRWLRSALIQAAWAAVKVKESHFAQVYRRLVARCGPKRAIMAVAHRLLIAVYHRLVKQEPYREPDPSRQEERRQARQVRQWRHQLEQHGYQVTPIPQAACAP